MRRRITAFLLSAVMIFGCFFCLGASGDTSEKVTVTVNYVYDSNKAMVAQPYSAQLAKGAAFQKTISVPQQPNYSIPVDKVTGLTEGITLADNELKFDLSSVTEDITVTLYYVAGKADYTVNHHYQNLSDDEYGEVETVTVQGDIDAYTQAVANTEKTGFICTGVPQYTIAADGTTVVDIYYDRVYYTVTFDVNGGINGPKPIYAKYGAPVTISSTPTRAGYTFVGWSPAVEETVTGNVTYQAQWAPQEGNADYTIVIWGQNANDDEYSYLSSGAANACPGDTVTWNADTYICEGSHVHSKDCYNLTCGLAEHTHDATCGLKCNHTHTAACYCNTNTSTAVASNPYYKYCSSYMKDGYVIYVEDNGTEGEGDKYYFFYSGKSYEITESVYNSLKYGSQVAEGTFKNSSSIFAITDHYYVYKYDVNAAPKYCNHTHTDECYNCGKTAHTHSALGGSCYTLICTKTSHAHSSSCLKMGSYAPDSSLWVYDHSDTVTVDADGSTVLNVYFNRKEFTITFKDGDSTVYNITERWGKDIRNHWPIKGTNGTTYNNGERWKPSETETYDEVLVYIAQMPAESFTLTKNTSSASAYTMNYYVETIAGGGTRDYSGKNFNLAFTVKAKYNFITETEDFFSLEGFTQWKSDPEFYGGEIDPSDYIADFYYTRNSYDLIFYSASTTNPDSTKSVKYQANMGSCDYTPVNKPNTVEPDAVFVGWYLNPQCTGEQYDLSAHNMPANTVALYAKWVNGLYTVTTYTDESETTLYTYDGYAGKQEKIVKYTTAPITPTAPTKDGYVFAGWFYKDTDGSEQPFSFTMPITQNYDLYPKFSNQAMVNYTVHYYLEGTTTKLADDRTNTARIGTTVTEKAKMGTELNLAEAGHNYFPDKTSTSVVLNSNGMEITFYYAKDKTVPYTVKYVDKNNEELLPDKVVSNNQFSVVTETYEPIENYTARQYQITQELSAAATQNVIVFVYDANAYKITYDANGGTLTSAGSQTYTIKDSFSLATAPTRAGYTFTGWKLETADGNWTADSYNAMQEFNPGMYGDVEMVAQWQANNYTITYDANGGTLMGASSQNYTVNDTVTIASAPTRDGYTFTGWKLETTDGNWPAKDYTYNGGESLTEKYGNVTLVAQWTEKTATINYIVVGPDGCGSVSPASETLNVVSGTASGSTATAKNGNYKFVGWYSDEACTKLVSSDAKFVPTKDAGAQWKDGTTYYAKFDWNVADLTITKSGCDTAKDPNQAFIFNVTGPDGYSTRVVIIGNGSVTLTNLTVGTYTVTEDTSWSWRYTPKNGTQTIEINPTKDNTVTFENERTNNKWIGDSSYAINRCVESTIKNVIDTLFGK